MRKNHFIYKREHHYQRKPKHGGGRVSQYMIWEESPAPDSPNQVHDKLIASFNNKEDRDNIFDAMIHGGYCSHSNKSWIRSHYRKEEPLKNNEPAPYSDLVHLSLSSKVKAICGAKGSNVNTLDFKVTCPDCLTIHKEKTVVL
jgi:hypothetical protein